MTRDSKPSSTSPRFWRPLALGIAALGFAAAPALALTPATPQASDVTHPLIWQTEAESEDGAAAAAGIADEEVAALSALSHFEAHLRVANDLYQAEDLGEAVTRMKRPEDEAYTELEAQIRAQGQPGFAEELTAMAAAIDGEAPVAEAEDAYEVVSARIAESREAVAGDKPADRFAAMTELLRSAAKEYEEGLTNAEPGDLHPYHKARGYVTIVRAEAETLAQSTDTAVSGAANDVLAALAGTDVAFPGLFPEGELPASGAELLQTAAAEVETTTRSLQ